MCQQYLKIKGEKVAEAFIKCKQCKTTTTATVRHDVLLYKWDLETATQTNRCGITGGLQSIHVCQKLMAAAWINGFVNGREATGKLESLSIYNRSNVPKKSNQQRRAE